jgi:adenosylhomocysteine nucleosidase
VPDLPSTLVVMALPVESSGVLEAAGVPVLYCGVGKVNAAIALTQELTRYAQQDEEMPLVVNFGTAGSRCHSSGTLVSCHAFVQRDMDVSGLGFPLGVTPYDEAPSMLIFDPVFAHLPAALCGSGDSFAVAEIAVDCEVLDMEAYALAKVCWHAEARFGCVKYVTDGADSSAAEDWQRNVHRAAEQFLQLFRGLTGSTE